VSTPAVPPMMTMMMRLSQDDMSRRRSVERPWLEWVPFRTELEALDIPGSARVEGGAVFCIGGGVCFKPPLLCCQQLGF